jgi:phosphoribosylformimino-5-aminoimidazole carboxamide ribotide isomerase
MELYPAIDIRDGGAVRLSQGDFDRQQGYGDPLALARRFVKEGARWLHVVDLDAARAGEPVNRPTVLSIAATVGVPVQTGGGVRSEADVEELLAGGVRRVILGTLALDDPGLARRLAAKYPGQVAVGIDYRLDAAGHTEVAVRGWEQGSGRSVGELLLDLVGTDIAAVIVTSIARDGMLTGPDMDGLREVLQATSIPVVASGGVGSVADIETLAALTVPILPRPRRGDTAPRRLQGVVCGKALADGRITVEEGLATCERSG